MELDGKYRHELKYQIHLSDLLCAEKSAAPSHEARSSHRYRRYLYNQECVF